MEEITDWSKLTPGEKKQRLFENQKALLDSFLARNAISREQYDISLNGLITKMGIQSKEKR